MIMAAIDLHTHSTASDGTLSPEALVQHVSALGVDLFALTDHDTIAGLAAAGQAAESTGVELLSGVEISTSWGRRSVHVVGLGFDVESAGLKQFLREQERQFLREQESRRQRRAEQLGERLARLGVSGALAGATAKAGGGVPGRAHFARYLVDQGRVPDFARAFKRYLGKGRPAYIQPQWPELPEVVAVIQQAGGAAVLAHPMRYEVGRPLIKELLLQFKTAGGDAIEVVTAGDDAGRIDWLGEQAVIHGFAGSVGSDFHSPEQRWIRPGALAALPKQVEPLWSRWIGATITNNGEGEREDGRSYRGGEAGREHCAADDQPSGETKSD